ncbi:3-ketoacyl-CoA thiolase 2, peroxisomal [Triticum urartu]|uniref:acetyl-CoA C-acyltransferase n=1 Tax=Triticum urartu TaxID=4572 RepID=M7YCT7_TRIUA|nr:3-ketoacyl-CoA thiolase 2, peroxisomal [Triticum urartu]
MAVIRVSLRASGETLGPIIQCWLSHVGFVLGLLPKASACAAGDSAAYQRSSCFGDDVVIVAAYRTPICKAKRGGFKDTYPEDLLTPVLKAVLDKTGINPAQIGDVVVGTVLGPGSQRAIECRTASLLAGIPETVPVRTVNRQCSSGLQAVADVAAAIKAGFYDIGIGAGLESMSVNSVGWEGQVNPRVIELQKAQDCLLPMGITSENVAQRYGVTREEQDKAAVESHARAAAATASGKFKDEIIPVHTKLIDPKTGEEKKVVISVDDGIRPGTTLSGLAKLKTVFKKDGTTTAGNSSQVSDGAGAVLLMKRSFAAVGVDPAVMGVGPAVAIPAAVKSAGLDIDDIDLFELNEAFASQFVYCCNKLGLDRSKVNVNGGAIAMGHPLGATGARCISTLLNEMKRRGRDCRFGVVTMCIGSGMGAAAVFERGDSVDELSNVRHIQSHNFLSKDAAK